MNLIKIDDIDFTSIISELKFKIEQLEFKNQQLYKIINHKNETIKMLENTLLENRNWDNISKNIDINIENDEIQYIYNHHITNHINSILIKKGYFKNNKLALKIIQSIKNIKII